MFFQCRNLTDTFDLSNTTKEELNYIQEYFNISKSSLNEGKNKFMIFHYRQRDIRKFVPEVKLKSEFRPPSPLKQSILTPTLD